MTYEIDHLKKKKLFSIFSILVQCYKIGEVNFRKLTFAFQKLSNLPFPLSEANQAFRVQFQYLKFYVLHFKVILGFLHDIC